jgi:2,3-bisphosphoglycerate-dependent phosphoglycerate mutase
MFKRIFSLLAVLGLCLSMAGKASAQMEETTTIIIMRHAEKESGKDPDPGLSPAGKQRAQKIATLLKDVPVTHVLTTQFKRTRETVEKLAEEKGLPIEGYDPAATDEIMDRIRAAKGETLVFAGHSNTAPELVNLIIGEKKYTALKEDDYGKIWVITMSMDRVVSCLQLNTN